MSIYRVTQKDGCVFESNKAKFYPNHVDMAGSPFPDSGTNPQGDFPNHLIVYVRETYQYHKNKIEKVEIDGVEIHPFK